LKKKPAAKKPKAWKPKVPYARMRASSRRLELRPFRPSDYEAWAEGYRKRLKKQHRFDEGPVQEKDLGLSVFRKKVAKQRKNASLLHQFFFPIFDKKSGAYLGGTDFYIINRSKRSANLGYFVHNHSWGKGYGPEAARLAMEIAFGALDLYRVEASCELQNEPSARVALKAGMFKEGMRRNYPIPIGMRDLYVFGMNSLDFKKRKRR
jgi:[ribosomal protein S5]-alanine N-acetyltransferase